MIIFPQRIVPIERPGTLLKRAFALRDAMKSEGPERGEAYLDHIRACPCLHCGQDPCGEASHLRSASGAHGKASGTGKRPDDRWALPVCPEHHRLAQRAQHQIGERAFWSDLGIDPFLTCQRLWAQRNDLVAMRAVVFAVIGERHQRSAPWLTT
jgi:hypothetical protein